MTPVTNNLNRPPAPDLGRLLSDVLGDLAFMIADDPPPAPSPGALWLHGAIRFDGGAHHGTARVWCSRVFAQRLAANLLGLEPGEGTVQVGAEDALREFLNVLCGQLVTTWYGTQDVFNLSIPEVTEALDPPPPPDPTAVHCRVQVDGEPVVCTVTRGG